jgi:hypothetical protein
MTYTHAKAGGSRFFHNVGTYLPHYMATLPASNNNLYCHKFKLFNLDDHNGLCEPTAFTFQLRILDTGMV